MSKEKAAQVHWFIGSQRAVGMSHQGPPFIIAMQRKCLLTLLSGHSLRLYNNAHISGTSMWPGEFPHLEFPTVPKESPVSPVCNWCRSHAVTLTPLPLVTNATKFEIMPLPITSSWVSLSPTPDCIALKWSFCPQVLCCPVHPQNDPPTQRSERVALHVVLLLQALWFLTD